jgi:hypothetical protein
MPIEDQLEIIGPGGEISFQSLNAFKGISYLGGHPENDIVLQGTGVGLFHALLDHRRRPFHVTPLTDESALVLNGAPLPINVPHELSNWDTISVGGFNLILLEAAHVPVGAPAPAELAAPASAVVASALAEAAPLAAPRRPRGPALPPSDAVDDIIVTDFSAREWTVDVDQTASSELTIANGGEIVATFGVRVEGVPESWVTVSPATINLNEGGRAAVSIALTPSRLSTSEAGAYPISVVVTSPNYPGRVSRRGGVLIVNPFYEFAVGDLSPRQQSVPWRKKHGEAVIPIANKGNSDTPFRLDGEDDEHGCRFEFQVPGETTALVKQAELRVAPGASVPVPVRITPVQKHLVGLRQHAFNYTITTTMLEGNQTPRTVMGQVSSAPLIGTWMVFLFLICLAAITAFIMRPEIYEFGANTQIASAGDRLVLRWNTKPYSFASLRIDPEIGPVSGAESSTTITATQDTTFKLRADNFLTPINPAWFGDVREFKVAVSPVPPVIKVFNADKLSLVSGESATISWEVQFAEKLSLVTNGVEETLLSTDYIGRRVVTPARATTYQLVAANRYEIKKQSVEIQVNAPTATPVPTATPLPLPVVERFDVQPQVITVGMSIKIDWAAAGVKSVTISPLPDSFPPTGSITDMPLKTTAYVLTASNGQTETKVIRQVTVNLAPPPPLAPKIEFFTITPDSVVRGSPDANNVKLSWSVIGDFTNIEVSGPDFGKVSNLDVQGTLTVAATKTTLFVLTAYNGPLLASLPVGLKVVEPTPVPPPTPAPPPPPNIVFFRAESGENPAQPDQVQPVASSGLPSNTLKYQVTAGSKVKFSWQVGNNPAKVTFVTVGDQPFQGDLTMVVRAGATYQLKAENAGGAVQAFIQIDLKPKPAPPAPFNVRGTYSPSPPLAIAWDYNPTYQDSITGFRLYRADTPSTTFRRVADESQLGKTVRAYSDGVAPTCGRIYYMVAVYYDVVSDAVKETAPSANSWASLACSPTPTPTP